MVRGQFCPKANRVSCCVNTAASEQLFLLAATCKGALEEHQLVATRQICKNFLRCGSCLMVGQMALQKTLLSEILFCSAKSSIMMGLLLLCTRFFPMRLEPRWCMSPMASSTSRNGGRTCRAFGRCAGCREVAQALVLHTLCRVPFAWEGQ